MPAGVTGDKPWRWHPTYKLSDRPGSTTFSVDGIESAECPVSAISGDARAWLAEYDVARWFADAGALPYGPNLSDWPARAMDAHQLIHIEQARLDNARSDVSREQ